MIKLLSGLFRSLWTALAATAAASLLLVILVRDPIYFKITTTRGLSESEIATIRDDFHLHNWQSLYSSWLVKVFNRDLGMLRRGGRVSDRLKWPFLRTGVLCFLSIFISMSIALLSVAATMAGRGKTGLSIALDRILSFLQGLPLFLVSTILWSLYAWLGWLHFPPDALFMAAILPATALIFADGSLSSLVSEAQGEAAWICGSEHIRAARARGLPEWRAMFLASGSIAGHVLRNMLVVIIERMRARILYVIGGALVVERVFDYSGVGVLLMDDGLRDGLDFNLIMAVILFTSILVVILRALADICLLKLDPRINAARNNQEQLRLHGDFLPAPGEFIDNIRSFIITMFPRIQKAGKRRWRVLSMLSAGSGFMLLLLTGLHHYLPEAASQLISAAGPTITLCIVAFIAVIVGLAAAVVSEWHPRFFLFLEWLLDVLETIPLYFVAVVVLAALTSAGRSSTYHVMAVVGLYLSTATIRVMHGKFAESRHSEYWMAGAVSGAGRGRLTMFYLLPNCTVNLLTTLCDQVGYTLHVVANLAFLGAGEYHNNLAALAGHIGARLFRAPDYASRTLAPLFLESWEEPYALMLSACLATVILIMTLNAMARAMLAGSRHI